MMRLHLTEDYPFTWAANWAASRGPTTGAVELLDLEAGQDWPHRILHALADALATHSDDNGWAPRDVEICLSPLQMRAGRRFPQMLRTGPWRDDLCARMAVLITGRGIRVTVTASTEHELGWMRGAAAPVAVHGLVRGGALGLVAGP